MELLPEYDHLVNALVAILCGSMVGAEREIRNKAAGLRTVVLICLGAAVFTMMSGFGGTSDDRIAANIITGIGFIGAGVIFKGRVSVQGLTTAAVIWIAAGIGMVAGIGYYQMAFALTICTLLILTLFSQLEVFFANNYWTSSLSITFDSTDLQHFADLQQLAKEHAVRTKRKTISKSNGRLSLIVEVSGKRRNITEFNDTLMRRASVKEFFYN